MSYKEKNLDPLALKQEKIDRVYQTIIDGFQIQLDPTDYDQVVAIINQCCSRTRQDGLIENSISKPLDRFKLKQLLEQAGFSANINLYSIKELEQRNLQGSILAAQKPIARELNLPLEKYQKLLESGQQAFQFFYENGPFYGTNQFPSFRIAAQPTKLSTTQQYTLTTLGQDLNILSQIISQLDPRFLSQNNLPPYVIYEPSFRVDLIIDNNDQLWLNEIQVSDGADALMIAEQLAYGIQTLDKTTAAYLVDYLLEKFPSNNPLNIAIVWQNEFNPRIDPYASNTIKMKQFIETVSNGLINIDLLSQSGLASNFSFQRFDGVISSGYIPTDYLFQQFNLQENQLITLGNTSPITNKALLALLSDPQFAPDWIQLLRKPTYERLNTIIPATRFIDNQELENCLSNPNLVTKVYYDPQQQTTFDSKGVFGSWNDKETINQAYQLLDRGCQFITQDFIQPQIFDALVLASGGKKLQPLSGPNRICAKFVKGELTATEITIGNSNPIDAKSQIIPAGRGCCFAPVTFN